MNIKAFKLTTVLALLTSSILITGCHKDFGPYAMPAGFKHHADKYKAPDGPEPVIVKTLHENGVRDVIPHDDDMVVTNAGGIEYVTLPIEFEQKDWNMAVADVVDRLIRSYDFNGKEVYITLPQTTDSNEVFIYDYLTSELPLRGINMGAAETSTLTLFYDYFTDQIDPDIENANQMTLTLILQEGANIVAEHSGHFIYDGSIMVVDQAHEDIIVQQPAIEPLTPYESGDTPLEITPYE